MMIRLSKVNFYTRFDPPPTVPVSSGNRFETVYAFEMCKDGSKVLKPTGEKKDLYTIIQQNAVGVSLQDVVKRCTLLQDDSLLLQRPASFVDATEFPTDYCDMQNKILRARDSFYKLTPDVRAQFSNDPDKFISSMFTPMWNDIMNLTVKENGTDDAEADQSE